MKTVMNMSTELYRLGGFLAVVFLSFGILADTNITGDVTLTAHTDWTGKGLVTVESGATVNLNGCTGKTVHWQFHSC